MAMAAMGVTALIQAGINEIVAIATTVNKPTARLYTAETTHRDAQDHTQTDRQTGTSIRPHTDRQAERQRDRYTYAWFLKQGVNLGLVNPRSEGYPGGKSQGKCFFATRRIVWFTNPGAYRQCKQTSHWSITKCYIPWRDV